MKAEDLLQKQLEETKEIFTLMEEDFTKFIVKNNKAAGTRVRTASIELGKKLKELRKTVLDVKTERK